MKTTESASRPLATWLPPAWLVLALVLANSFFFKLCYLDHTSLTRWDEVHHAVVAQNVMKHPLRPTLIDVPYLPYDHTKWSDNHIWLHKPILPFWQMALFLAIFGVNTFALRLPSALLSTGAAWLTYLIGKRLFGRGAGLIAATLQATNPFLLTLIQGYQFADHIDIALLFWVELGILFLVRSLSTGSWRDLLLAAVAQGLAFLSKSYLAGIIFGIALTAWLLPILRLARRSDCRIDLFRLFVLLDVTLITVTPWLAYCLINYPQEFWFEEEHIWSHLSSGVGPWGAPWTRVIFDYLIGIYGVFYTPVIVATVVLLGRAFIKRHAGSWLVLAWGLGVVVPHLLARTKTPSATMLAMPAAFLLVGCLIAAAWRGERVPLATLVAVLVMSVLYPAFIKDPRDNLANPVLAGVMYKSGWVTIHVAGALGIFAALVVLAFLFRRFAPAVMHNWGGYVRIPALLFCLAVLIWMGYRTANQAWLIASANLKDSYSSEAGQYARARLPTNAVLICEESRGYEHLATMFYADRTCYALENRGADDMARRIVHAGGSPYVVSYQQLPLTAVHVFGNRGPTIYLWEGNR